MATIKELQDKYENLKTRYDNDCEGAIDTDCLLAFDYEYPDSKAEVVIDTDEFTTGCPWTGLPDFGTLAIIYVPHKSCIELKSLKYYIMSYRNVSLVQEHAANLILKHLVALCHPSSMIVRLDYKVRGGLHTTVEVSHRGRISDPREMSQLKDQD